MLIDSDVFIWALNGNIKAVKILDTTENIEISVITYMEIVQGLDKKSELQSLLKYFQQLNIQVIHLDKNISELALEVVMKYYHSNSLELADALIGATGIIHNTPLITGNYKHFKVFTDLDIQVFRP